MLNGINPMSFELKKKVIRSLELIHYEKALNHNWPDFVDRVFMALQIKASFRQTKGVSE